MYPFGYILVYMQVTIYINTYIGLTRRPPERQKFGGGNRRRRSAGLQQEERNRKQVISHFDTVHL